VKQAGKALNQRLGWRIRKGALRCPARGPTARARRTARNATRVMFCQEQELGHCDRHVFVVKRSIRAIILLHVDVQRGAYGNTQRNSDEIKIFLNKDA
jgi:hypothetical protein